MGSTNINKKKQFNIVVNPESYSIAEKHGYSNAVFDGEEIKGNVEVSLAKPEMVKCIRLQLIGFISKSSRLNLNDVLKYVNNPLCASEGNTIISKLNTFKKSSNEGSSRTLNGPTSAPVNNAPSKFDSLEILVDYDVILWGKYSKKEDKSNELNQSKNRKELINHDFVATRMSCDSLVLPFSFYLYNKKNPLKFALPSSFKEGKCKIGYFLYATINRPWPRKNSHRIMFLRVLQKIKVDVPKYLKPVEEVRVKELKFLKYINKGVIEMKVKIPKSAYCHRENIPIDVNINHMGMNKSIFGIAVGLYEKCLYENQVTKLFTKNSFKLVTERFYEFKVVPGEIDRNITLNFPIVDGNCYIKKKFLLNATPFSPLSPLSQSNTSPKSDLDSSNEDMSAMEGNMESIDEEEVISVDKEEDQTKIKLSDAKVGKLSTTIDDDKWPIKVIHILRVVAITNEYMANMQKKAQQGESIVSDNNTNRGKMRIDNNYEEYTEMDSQIQIQVTSPGQESNLTNSRSSMDSFPTFPTPSNSESKGKAHSLLQIDVSKTGSSKSQVNSPLFGSHKEKDTLYSYNEFSPTNGKNHTEKQSETKIDYGIITGYLSNGQYPSIPKSQKNLDCEFNIIIGSLSNTKRTFGNENELMPEIEEQYFNAIIQKAAIVNKLKLNNIVNSNHKEKEESVKLDGVKFDSTKYNSTKFNSVKLRTVSCNDSNLSASYNNLCELMAAGQNSRQRSYTVSSSSTNHLQPTINKSIINKELPTIPVPVSQGNSSQGNSSLSPSVIPRSEYIPTSPLSNLFPSSSAMTDEPISIFPYLPNDPNNMPSAPNIEDIDFQDYRDSPPPPYEFNEEYANVTTNNEKSI